MNFTLRIGLCLMLGASWLLFAPNVALACSCDLPQKGKTLKQQVVAARNKSGDVFVGKVLEVISDPRKFHVDVKFEVERSWKHDTSKQVIVRTGRGGGDCGYHFEVGESYLVYAYRSNENKLETNICQRTRSLVDAKDDLRLLGKTKANCSSAQKPQKPTGRQRE